MDGDCWGLAGFPPKMRQPVHDGMRHPYCILAGVMSAELLGWLREDLSTAAPLNIDFRSNHGRKDVKVEHNRKWIMAGKLADQCATQTICTLCLKKDLPMSRLRAFLDAFKAVNQGVFADLHQTARMLSKRPGGGDGPERNRNHFLDCSFEEWWCNCGELCISDAQGSWAEDEHQDGGASVLHFGVTLWGSRDVRCTHEKPATSPSAIVVPCVPGSVYMGTLTGPWHGVTHRPSPGDQLLDRAFSASVMIRTSLFGHDRSRVKDTTPAPQDWFFDLAALFTSALSEGSFRLPSLAESKRFFSPPLATSPSPMSLETSPTAARPSPKAAAKTRTSNEGPRAAAPPPKRRK
jgi:hypothetical protein